jgi:hypothetical protein
MMGECSRAIRTMESCVKGLKNVNADCVSDLGLSSTPNYQSRSVTRSFESFSNRSSPHTITGILKSSTQASR